ncbi:MAG TPA: hypothetical protein PK530_18745 [Anaerolineales bacterium]|nr:hypothetical protein [Anaerolineales bacterium]
MKFKFPVISTVVAVISGLAVLFLYFLPLDFMDINWRSMFLQWATTLGAVALLIGLINLASVHSRKLDDEGPFPFNSLVLVIAMALTFGLVLIFGPASTPAMFILNYIQIPVETSLVAILAVTLIYASARLVRRKTDPFSLVFIVTTLLILAMTSPLVTDLVPSVGETLRAFRDWVANVPATAGARGILLGIALGTIATGIRVLMGVDRPYGG